MRLHWDLHLQLPRKAWAYHSITSSALRLLVSLTLRLSFKVLSVPSFFVHDAALLALSFFNLATRLSLGIFDLATSFLLCFKSLLMLLVIDSKKIFLASAEAKLREKY